MAVLPSKPFLCSDFEILTALPADSPVCRLGFCSGTASWRQPGSPSHPASPHQRGSWPRRKAGKKGKTLGTPQSMGVFLPVQRRPSSAQCPGCLYTLWLCSWRRRAGPCRGTGPSLRVWAGLPGPQKFNTGQAGVGNKPGPGV